MDYNKANNIRTRAFCSVALGKNALLLQQHTNTKRAKQKINACNKVHSNSHSVPYNKKKQTTIVTQNTIEYIIFNRQQKTASTTSAVKSH